MTGHIFIEDEIGGSDSFNPGAVTTKTIRADIAAYPQATDWNVHINSGGGDVDEGYAIGSILRNLPKTTAIIGATCASIATYDALSCDHVVMGPSGDFTIHLPTAVIGGNANEHRAAATRLDRIKAELLSLYMKRVAKKGIKEQQVSEMIDKETSMSPGEALAMGFVDEVQEKFKAVAKIDLKKFNNMENDLNKKEVKGWFDKLEASLKKFINPKNAGAAVPVTLTDGTVLNVMADDPNNLQGASVTMGDGSPCADGVYESVDGQELTVASGIITEVDTEPADAKPDVPPAKPAAPPAAPDVKDLQAQIASLQAQLAAQTAAGAANAKEAVEFKNQMETIGKEFNELKTKTFGNPNPPKPKPDAQFKNQDEEEIDEETMAFAGHLTGFLESRNLIKKDDE